MDNDIFSSIESIADKLNGVLNVLIFIAKFLFLSPWGWILIFLIFLSMVIVRVKNKKDKVTFYTFIGGISETLFLFYTAASTILIGLFIILIVFSLTSAFSGFTKSLRLFQEIKTLEATIQNLRSDRKVLELTAIPTVVNNTNRMNITVTYFAYSPVEDKDIETGQSIYSIEGKKIFVDFGVINFKYSLIENGEAVNIAFPNKIYSESVAYENGVNIFAAVDDMPLTFRLSDEEIYVLDEYEYNAQIMKIIQYATNEELSRKMGLRAAYGQSIAVRPIENKIYAFYSTASGGMILK